MFAGLIYVVGVFVEFLVGLRVLFLLLGANPANAFVHWIYTWSSPFVAPFSGIFGQHNATVAGQGVVVTSVFDWTGLIAFIVYGFIVGALGHVARRY
jgi:hypothetical protein